MTKIGNKLRNVILNASNTVDDVLGEKYDNCDFNTLSHFLDKIEEHPIYSKLDDLKHIYNAQLAIEERAHDIHHTMKKVIDEYYDKPKNEELNHYLSYCQCIILGNNIDIFDSEMTGIDIELIKIPNNEFPPILKLAIRISDYKLNTDGMIKEYKNLDQQEQSHLFTEKQVTTYALNHPNDIDEFITHAKKLFLNSSCREINYFEYLCENIRLPLMSYCTCKYMYKQLINLEKNILIACINEYSDINLTDLADKQLKDLRCITEELFVPPEDFFEN